MNIENTIKNWSEMSIWGMLMIVFFSCSFEKERKDNFEKSKVAFYYDSILSNNGHDSLKIFIRNDSLHFVVSGDSGTLASVPWHKKNFSPNHKLKGIFTMQEKVLLKQEVRMFENKIFFTISDEQYRGNLYVLDTQNLSFFRDNKWNRDFLLSNSGIFLFDEDRNLILAIATPVLDEKSDEMVTPVYVYRLENNSFQLIDSGKTKGELIYNDSLVHSFFMNYQMEEKIK